MLGFWATAVETRFWAMLLAVTRDVLTGFCLPQLEIVVNPKARKIAEICLFESKVIGRWLLKAEVGSPKKSINASKYSELGI